MKRLFRKKEGGSHDFWMSYTDMMSAFLIVFMIGCIYAFNGYQRKTVELDYAKARVECHRNVSVETNDIKPIFDDKRGSIKLIDKTPNGELFESGKASFYRRKSNTVLPLKPYLEKIYTALVDTTMSIARRKNVNIELRIEGHTDPNWNELTRGSGESYIRNLKLSSERANAVYELILRGDRLSDAQRTFLMQHMISVGYSFSERIENNNIDNMDLDAQSRRIEFRIISK